MKAICINLTLRVIGITLLSFSSIVGRAQFNIVSPSNYETGEYLFLGGTITCINNSAFTNSYGTGFALTYDDGSGGKPYFKIRDNNNNQYFGQIAGLGAGYTYSNPDIVIGGTDTSNYLGVLYTAVDGSGNSDIYLEVYRVTGIGTGPSISNCATYIFNVCNTTHHAVKGRIDLLNRYDVATSENMAEHFCIVWEEDASSSFCVVNAAGGLKACHGSLMLMANNCNSNSVTYISGCVNNNIGNPMFQFDGNSADVAVYQRGASQIASFTFVDQNGKVYLRHWDFSNPGVSGGVIVANAGTNDNPKIEVADCQPGGSDASIDIVYRHNNGSTYDVMQWTDYTSPNSGEAITSYYNDGTHGTGLFDNFSPVVASGPSTGSQFSVAYANPSPGSDSIFLQNVMWGTYLADVDGNGDNVYYQVNKNDGIDAPVAICNDWDWNGSNLDPGYVYVCWFNPSNNSGEIDCKKTNSSTPSFKPTGVETIKNTNFVALYPNPAVSDIILTSSNGVLYSIYDMGGHQVLNGSIINKKQGINVSTLQSGVYLMSIKNADNTISNTKFIKQ